MNVQVMPNEGQSSLVKRNADIRTTDIAMSENTDNQEETPMDVRLLTCLVKRYVFMKQQMVKTLSKSVATILHSEGKLTDKTYYAIKNCEERRRTNELLLQTVMLGSTELQASFVKALDSEEQRIKKYPTISPALKDEDVTENDMNAFSQINGRSVDESTFTRIPKEIHRELKVRIDTFHSDDKEVANLLDRLLCRFIISIKEKERLSRYLVGDVEKTLEKLKRVLRRRPEDVYSNLLSSIYGDSTERLITKRKRLNSENEPIVKRRCRISKETEENIIEKLKSAHDVSIKTEERFAFEIESLDKGSIKIKLRPKASNSWDILKQQCKNECIIDYIPEVYKQDPESLEEGEYIIDFKILKYDEGEQAVAEFHFESTDDQHEVRCGFQENWNLLTEELEITGDLLSLLTEKSVLNVQSAEKIEKEKDRETQITQLLEILKTKGQNGYKILLDYIERLYPCLYGKMIQNEHISSIGDNINSTTNVSDRTRWKAKMSNSMFYAASVVLSVSKEDSRKSKRSKTGVKIRVKTVLSTKCFFDEGACNTQLAEPDKKTIDFDVESRKSEREVPAEKQVSRSKKKKRESDS